ncbi:MAG: Eco57I restriction-modification methylase domain-containing protein [Saprospiraceae bacterium]|nr:Eco57I restriction-modification methylase domain-containing protein [Saprospiraceae bacterium]
MNMIFKTPLQSISKSYFRSPVLRPEIDRFKRAFISLESKLDPNQREDHLKNLIRDFLLDAYYKDQFEINIKENKDLVIHHGAKSTYSVGVIIEAKSIKNVSEMVSQTDLNKKALQEIILYYLVEREDFKNINIKHLIITNTEEWYVFDENDFEKLIYRNTKFLRQYKDFKLSGKDTRHFYTDIAKPFIETIKHELPFTYFNISQYKNFIVNDNDEDDSNLIELYKLLSPVHLLKKPFVNDSNTLNKDFYNELLHIIGLEEVKENGKKVIQRREIDNRNPASLIENTINILKFETNVPSSTHYEIALELCITWINRILFLKLLESQLIKYHKGNRHYQFLNYEKIVDYDTLNKLFFQVLAIRPADRSSHVKDVYDKIPYLNSSLFEVNELETRTLKISNLEDNLLIPLYFRTVLKDEKGKSKEREINTLQYLFEFLDAYNFSSEGIEKIQEENKSLINASVLGLIFEKINGYKDGSYFTPGFVTMYMCKEIIRKAVIQKFNDHTEFESQNWDELKNYIGKPYKKEELKKYNTIIDSLKICDPAVGSGHFLVSALNEIIAIKSELNLLCDQDFNRLPILASVDNDELIIESENHKSFEYDLLSKESRTIQKALFEQKQHIIENCLFGVDINPNSVKICTLRLWIELLKHAYYTEESQLNDLETLPNIDINIKCGNSLIRRFDLDSDLGPALKKSKFSIEGYKLAVSGYKEVTNKENKQEFKHLINTIKGDFRSEVGGKELRDLQKLEGLFYNRFGSVTLIDVELSKSQAKEKERQKNELLNKIEAKKAEIEEIKSNKIYEAAFEWRFEFPEVLDDEGKFLGFDVIIGNPPYIRQEEFSSLKPYLSSKFITYKGTADLYVYFVELGMSLLSDSGHFVYIIPNKWMRAGYGFELRDFVLNKRLLAIYDFGDLPVFEEATTYPCILMMKNNDPQSSFVSANIDTLQFDSGLENYLADHRFEVQTSGLVKEGWTLSSNKVQQLLEKLKRKGLPLGEYVKGKIFYGIKTGYNEAFVIDQKTRDRLIEEDPRSEEIIKPFLAGRDIKRYESPNANKYLIFARRGIDINLYPSINKHLSQYREKLEPMPKDWGGTNWTGRKSGTYKWYEIQDAVDYYEEFNNPKVMYQIFQVKPVFLYDDRGFYCNNSMYILPDCNLTTLGILNSKLGWFQISNYCTQIQNGVQLIAKYFENISLLSKVDITLENLVKEAIRQTNSGLNTEEIESQIDLVIYKLYDLDYEDVLIIDPNFEMAESEYNAFQV